MSLSSGRAGPGSGRKALEGDFLFWAHGWRRRELLSLRKARERAVGVGRVGSGRGMVDRRRRRAARGEIVGTVRRLRASVARPA